MDAGRRAAAIDRAPVAPKWVWKLQARRRLSALGLLDALDAWLALDATRAAEWDAASQINRDDDLTRAFAVVAGMTADDIDTFFREAAKL